jgi:hypothetical protein
MALDSILFAIAASTANVQAAPPPTIAQPLPIVRVHHEASDDMAPVQPLANLPSDSWPVTDWYKQNVFDRSDNKVGEIMDVLVDHGGKNVAIMISVGGFLGIGEKTVAVPFDAVRFKKKDNSWQPIINASKDALQKAPGYKYDRNAKTWTADKAPATTGGPAR